MDREYINILLKHVIHEARELNIPVPSRINEKVTINPRPRRRFGCCNTMGGIYNIEISEFILACPEEKIRGVLAHEVLHTCRGCRNHGDRWKQYAEKMNKAYGYNIKRASSFEEMGLTEEPAAGAEKDSAAGSKIKYIIKCTKCGKEYPRQRYTCVMKKINAYRCQCGGRLEVHQPNKYT